QQYYVFPVDEVGGVDRIDDTHLDAAPATLSQAQAEFVKGLVKIDNLAVAYLNAAQIFNAFEEAIGV
ncbi:MAG: hypothetical protein AMJ53_15015, partial [Gammaproteobacteria bacterium SG8_11]